MSAIPSPSGDSTIGSSDRPVRIDVGTGGGGAGAGARPIVPVAGRVLGPASIVQVYAPGATPAQFQVHATARLVPVPRATSLPGGSVTVTVPAARRGQPGGERDGPPSLPEDVGAYSFGSPVDAAWLRDRGQLRVERVPGQLVNPVSRWPEIVARA